jgi:hypothetical protein
MFAKNSGNVSKDFKTTQTMKLIISKTAMEMAVKILSPLWQGGGNQQCGGDNEGGLDP